MITPRHALLVALSLALLPAAGSTQALTDLTSLRVGYSGRRNEANPTGELKARLDSLERDFAAALRLGRTGEARRLLAKGNVLLSGREWTDVLELATSLVIRSDRVVVDSRKPYAVRVEQIYTPSIELPRPLTAHVALKTRPSGAGATRNPGELVKDLGTHEGVSRDLRESPFAIELDLHDVPDGTYQVAVEVLDSARVLGTPTLTIALRQGIDDVASRLEATAKNAPETARAEILFPVDRMRTVNRGRMDLRTLDMARDFAAAESVAVAVAAGKDPFRGRTGDIERHYLLDAAGEVMPYRLYVPTTYTPARAFPLVVALHGLGATEDSFFESYGKRLPALAEQHGYIVVAPLGYRVDGFYGYGVGTPPADPAERRRTELSEQDVLQVLAQVRKLYTIDDRRVYLMGHSMGAIGTWRLAAKHAGTWAALGAFSGLGDPRTAERMRALPQFVVHGDADPIVSVQGSRRMVAAMKALNMTVEYIEVPGGDHLNVVVPNLEGMFRFFDAQASRSMAPR